MSCSKIDDGFNVVAFYKSEELSATLNPAWKSFDLSYISSVHTASHLVCLRVWVRDGETKPARVHIECDMDLRQLSLCDNQDHGQVGKQPYIT